MASRRLADKPADALEAYLPARAPNTRPSSAMATIRMPKRYTTERLAASRPLSDDNGGNKGHEDLHKNLQRRQTDTETCDLFIPSQLLQYSFHVADASL